MTGAQGRALGRRVVSWGWDYLVVLAWLACVFLIIGLPQLLGWVDLTAVWSRSWTADIGVTVVTVIPYLTYLSVTESAAARGTWGKRRVALRVGATRGPLPPWRILVRNTVKVLPWQLGHMSAMRFAIDELRTGTWLFTTSMLLLAAIVVPVLIGRRGLHDRLAGTEVRAGSGGRSS